MTDSSIAPPSESWLVGNSGLRIFTRHWEPAGTARASLVICHGFNSHGGHYVRTAEAFAAQGFAVTAADLRGRGQSEGERFYVESIADYVDDLSRAIDFAKAAHPGLPLYLLGHSAGGVTAVSYALDHQDRIDGLICESFAFRVPAPDLALKLIEGASHVLPHVHLLRLKMTDFSRDPAWVAMLESDPLVKDEVQPIQTVAALARAAERMDQAFAAITLPVLIVHGTQDHATRPDGSQQFFDEAGSADKTLKFYEGHFHDLLADVGHEQVLADMLGWIEARLPVKAEAAMPLAT